jgi:glycosyltransferase involved in cell wall biosynthesis
MAEPDRPLRIALIGDRGIPARYSGFSTLVEELAVGLVRDHGMDVTVYCRNQYYEERPSLYKGVKCRYLPAPGGKSFESIVHSNFAVLDASVKSFDLVFVVDPGNGPFVIPLRLRGIPVVIHTDGLGWQRRKWSPLQQRYYKWSEWVSARLATWLVTDSFAMQRYYREEYQAESTYIPYSGAVGDEPDINALADYGVTPGNYYLVVARMEPENNVDHIIREYRASGVSRPLVVVGSVPYESDYARAVAAENDGQVRCVGGVFESAKLNALYRHCAAYLHGHEVGGTNPSLLRAMHWGAPCVPINVVFHRENVGEDNPYFDKTPGHLAAILRELDADPARRTALGQQAQAHAAATFRWDAVVDGYAQLFRRLIDLKARRQRLSVDVIGEMYHPERFAPEPAPAPDKTASVS